MKTDKRNYAFTLAEVLITLVIIGIIAAITIPSLINKTNNQETISRLKKVYSTMAQATNQIIAEEGSVMTWATSSQNLYDLYKKKLRKSKECNYSSGCFTQEKIYWLNSGSLNVNTNVWNNLVLDDGTQIMFSGVFSSTCELNNKDNNGTNFACTRILIDVNGAKKPNTMGKDLFEFVLKKNGLYPAGCDIDNQCNKNFNGRACACRVLREEEINY